MKEYTCVTLSREPLQRAVDDDTVYLNYVSTFDSAAGVYAARNKAVEKVTTPYFFFLDYDDPYPEGIQKPTKGILYGDFYCQELDMSTSIKKGRPWTIDAHYSNPYLIHKAICNTEQYKEVLPYLPESGDYRNEILNYFLLAACFGAEYVPEFQATWVRSKTGLHMKSKDSKQKSYNWLRNNKDRIVKEIKKSA